MVLGDESNEQWRISVRQTNEQITCNWSCHARVSTMATCFEWSLKIAEFLLPRVWLNICFKDLTSLQIFWMFCEIGKLRTFVNLYMIYLFYFLWNFPIECNARDLSEHLPYVLLWVMGMELHGSLHQTTLRLKDHYKRKNNQLPKYHCRHFQ